MRYSLQHILAPQILFTRSWGHETLWWLKERTEGADGRGESKSKWEQGWEKSEGKAHKKEWQEEQIYRVL